MLLGANFNLFFEMKERHLDHKIIFGLKVRQLRLEQQLSFADLSKRTGLSISYLNEIEKGKKFPKPDKIQILSDHLGTSISELTSKELRRNLAPIGELLNSNFLNELPLELFGIELIKVVEIIADAPSRVGAFIAALVGIAKNYALSADNFYFAAMRAYQELYYNYFEDLEESVTAFLAEFKLDDNKILSPNLLHDILDDHFHYDIVKDGLAKFPELAHMRSVWVPSSKKLLLQKDLSESQKAFQYGKEIGFNYLQIKDHNKTATLLNPNSFDIVLNNYRASYFSVALLVNKNSLQQKLSTFFSYKEWNGAALLKIIESYQVSAEIFFQRGNILPKYFGLDQLFFFRMVHDPVQDILVMDKELHLDHQHYPHANNLNENYCKRWVSNWLLDDLLELQQKQKKTGNIIAIQRSKYEQSDDEYLCISVARKGHQTMPGKNVSVTIGIKVDDSMRKVVRFADDPLIPRKVVNITCQRCAIVDCKERVAPPTWIEEKNKRKQIRKILQQLENDKLDEK